MGAGLHQSTIPTMQVVWQPPLGFLECRVWLPMRWLSRPPRPPPGGSLAKHGIGKRDKQAVWILNASGAIVEEVEHGVGSSYEATVWRKLEDGTRNTYTGALYKFLRGVE